MAGFLRVIRDLMLLIVRIAFGVLMITHGWRRWQTQGVGSQIAYLTQFSVPYPRYAAWGAIILELVGGIFLIVGALTPLVALAFAVEQGLTIAYTNWYRHLFLVDSAGVYRGGYEFSAALGMVALLLLVFGAGRVSVDQLFRRGKNDDELPDDAT